MELFIIVFNNFILISLIFCHHGLYLQFTDEMVLRSLQFFIDHIRKFCQSQQPFEVSFWSLLPWTIFKSISTDCIKILSHLFRNYFFEFMQPFCDFLVFGPYALVQLFKRGTPDSICESLIIISWSLGFHTSRCHIWFILMTWEPFIGYLWVAVIE